VTASRKPADKGNGDFFVTAWDTATGTKKGEYREEAGYGTPFVTTAPDNKTAVAVTSKSELASFDLATGKLARPLELKGRPPGLAPVFSADGKKLAVVCQADFGGKQTATILVYDWETGKVKHTFSVTGGTPACAIFTPDGKRLITGSPDTTATVWDVSQ
jgi:COMPASS component SWD3